MNINFKTKEYKNGLRCIILLSCGTTGQNALNTEICALLEIVSYRRFGRNYRSHLQCVKSQKSKDLSYIVAET
jgi:hypothetical protein